MSERKQGKNFSPAGKVGALVAGFIQISLLVSALLDIRRRPAAEVRGPKWAWALVSFINFAGPISYFVFGRKRAPQQLPPA